MSIDYFGWQTETHRNYRAVLKEHFHRSHRDALHFHRSHRDAFIILILVAFAILAHN